MSVLRVKTIKRVVALLLLSVILSIIPTKNVFASGTLSVRQENITYLFIVPGGGFSSCVLTVTYREKYTTQGSSSIFNERYRTCYGTRTYVTSIPIINLESVTHRNASGGVLASFTSWAAYPAMFSPEIDFGFCQVNFVSKTYAMTTTNFALLNYSVYCSGAMVPTIPGSLQLSLRTK
ncbi:MAG: hypothetical protein IK016_05125 [Lachnospiraceae bacterium]|nr:hypothetical protein [Lachnospiraceae bacterium]